MSLSFPIEDLQEVWTFEPSPVRTVDKTDILDTEEISIEDEKQKEPGYFKVKDRGKQGKIAVTWNGQPPSTGEVAVTGNFGDIKHKNIQSKKGYIINKLTLEIIGIIATLESTLAGRLERGRPGSSRLSTYWEPPREASSIENEIEKSIDMEKWKWIKQLADALDYLHTKRIIHRDITPRCCLINDGRDLKLGDFGSPVDVKDLLYPFYRMGPAMYYPLEVLKKDQHSFPADVYSFMLTAIFISSNKNPFDDTKWQEQSFEEVCQLIESSNQERVHLLKQKGSSLFASLLSSDPNEREPIGKIKSYFEEEDPSSCQILKILGNLVTYPIVG